MFQPSSRAAIHIIPHPTYAALPGRKFRSPPTRWSAATSSSWALVMWSQRTAIPGDSEMIVMCIYQYNDTHEYIGFCGCIIRIYIILYIHTYIHTHTQTYIHTYIHTDTHIHTYIHTYILLYYCTIYMSMYIIGACEYHRVISGYADFRQSRDPCRQTVQS